jgi:hypothetical protein
MKIEVGAPAMMILGLAGAGTALAMARSRGRGPARLLLRVFAWIMGGVLMLAVPDARALVAVHQPHTGGGDASLSR